MNAAREETYRSLKRMLSNGPLAGVPKRPSDQELLLALAAARFDPAKIYTEAEINEILKGWLGTFCDPAGIDHVTLRRMLVDSRRIERTRSGSTYRVNPDQPAIRVEGEPLDPAHVLAEIATERAARKRQHPD